MRKLILVVIVFVLCVHLYEAKDFGIGTQVNNVLISTEKVFYRALPLITTEKDYIYQDPKHRVIKGISARDLSRTDAEVTVAAGGVGETHVTLHFKSERGGSLYYLIRIFTKDK